MDEDMKRKKFLKKISWINTQLLTAIGIRRDHFVRAKQIVNKRLNKIKG